MSPALPGAPRLVVGSPSYSEGRQECPPRVWYSPEIDASKFTLHILSDTPGGLQWLKYSLLMLCNATRRLDDGQCVILRQRVRGSVRAVRAVRNTRVFLTETRVVADVWDPKRRTGDWNQLVWPIPANPTGWPVRVRVWPAKSQWFGLLDGSGTEPTCFCDPNPDRWRVNRTRR